MSRKAKSSKPAACEACQGTDLVRRIATYPVRLTGALEGKQIHVGRVALHECPIIGALVNAIKELNEEIVRLKKQVQ